MTKPLLRSRPFTSMRLDGGSVSTLSCATQTDADRKKIESCESIINGATLVAIHVCLLLLLLFWILTNSEYHRSSSFSPTFFNYQLNLRYHSLLLNRNKKTKNESTIDKTLPEQQHHRRAKTRKRDVEEQWYTQFDWSEKQQRCILARSEMSEKIVRFNYLLTDCDAGAIVDFTRKSWLIRMFPV